MMEPVETYTKMRAVSITCLSVDLLCYDFIDLVELVGTKLVDKVLDNLRVLG